MENPLIPSPRRLDLDLFGAYLKRQSLNNRDVLFYLPTSKPVGHPNQNSGASCMNGKEDKKTVWRNKQKGLPGDEPLADKVEVVQPCLGLYRLKADG
jgi:hypothetical protein